MRLLTSFRKLDWLGTYKSKSVFPLRNGIKRRNESQQRKCNADSDDQKHYGESEYDR